ncbi:DUF4435 domain-containing protein [Aeromonas hydrophila]
MGNSSRVAEMQKKGRGVQATFLRFTRIFNPNKIGSKFYFFLEGADDPEYYQNTIRKIISPYEWDIINCEGREFVTGIIELLSTHTDNVYKNCLYFGFIDRDHFEVDDRKNARIYTIPSYSIENQYATDEFMQEVLKIQFSLSPENSDNRDFHSCMNNFIEARNSFCSAIKNLDCYIRSTHLEHVKNIKTHTLNLSNVKLNDFLSVSLKNHTKINKNPDFWHLEAMGLSTLEVLPETFEESIRIYNGLSDKHLFVRGKFVLWFMNKYISELIDEHKKNNMNLFSDSRKDILGFKKTRLALNGSEIDFISKLSVYSTYPNCLIQFLTAAKKIAVNKESIKDEILLN